MLCHWLGLPGSSDGKYFAYKAGDPGLSPGWGNTLKKGMATHSSYSCLENSMDREAWQSTVHGVAKSWTWLSN